MISFFTQYKLRARIFISLILFIVIIVAVGAYTLILSTKLPTTVGDTVRWNYLADSAAQEMILALSRMDVALQRSRTGDKDTGRLMFDTNARLFEGHLESQFTNVAMLAHSDLLLQLRTNLAELRFVANEMLTPESLRAEQRSLYDNQIVQRTLGINLLLGKLRDTVRENIFATGKTIQRLNRNVTGMLILGLVIALLISAYTSYKLGSAILKPIQTLTRAARSIGQGNLDVTVPVYSNDELGTLATTFNKMAGQLNTYRQSTTEQIIRLHRTMESALASFTDPVFILDNEGRIELKNRAAQELSAQLSYDGALPPKLATAAAKAIETGKDFLPDNFDQVITLRVTGDEKSFLPLIHLMRDGDARSIGVAVVLHDVTRFRLLDDAKTNLVATVSHELKTPLTSVRMVLHLLLEKGLGPLNKKLGDLIETARKDSERLLKMLDELLDIARLEAGASSLTKDKISPTALVNSIYDEALGSVRSAGMKIVCDIAPSLPDVMVDRQQIGPVFHNFISNAVKHSPAGATIVIAASVAPDNGVQFSVRDQGAGIAEEHQGLIFDRFYRVPGQTKRGVGLGLSIAREIVVAHGGRVGVHSEPGKGSEFYFVLDAV